MRFLITGGAGFIGSHIVDILIKDNHEVIVVDNLSTGKKENINPKAEFHELDIISPNLEKIFQKKLDFVIHLAAQVSVSKSMSNPLEDAQTNILGGLQILKLCKEYNVKIVYASSAAEIGEPKQMPIRENHLTEPLSPYGLSKNVFLSYLELFHRLYGLQYTALRYSNVYGPRQNHLGEGGVIAIFTNQTIKNLPSTIFGDGEQSRDFIYVEDVAKATILAAFRGRNTIYHLGTGTETTINKLFKQIQTIVGLDNTLNYKEKRDGDIKQSVFNVTKIKNELNWRPLYSLEEGLAKTVDYFKNET